MPVNHAGLLLTITAKQGAHRESDILAIAQAVARAVAAVFLVIRDRLSGLVQGAAFRMVAG